MIRLANPSTQEPQAIKLVLAPGQHGLQTCLRKWKGGRERGLKNKNKKQKRGSDYMSYFRCDLAFLLLSEFHFWVRDIGRLPPFPFKEKGMVSLFLFSYRSWGWNCCFDTYNMIEFFKISIYVCGCFAFMYVCAPNACLVSEEARKGNPLELELWELNLDPLEHSTANALKCWAISPAPLEYDIKGGTPCFLCHQGLNLCPQSTSPRPLNLNQITFE